MKAIRILPFFLLLILLACKNQQLATSNGKNPPQNNRLKESDQRAFDAAFYEGNKQMILGNYNDAINYFKKCVVLDPKNDATLYLLAKNYNLTHQFGVSLPYAQEAGKLNDKNVWYQLLIADDLNKTDKSAEAAKAFENIADKFKTYETYYFDASENYIITKKFNDALRCLDKLEKISGVNEEISFKKEDLYIKLSKKDAAISEMQKLIAAFPYRPRYKVALAEIYFGFKEEDKANEVLKKVLATEPKMPEAHLLLASIYRNKGENEKSFQELKIVFENPDAEIRKKLEILSSYIPVMDLSATTKSNTKELGALLVKAHPDDDACNMIYADILYYDEQYLEAKHYYLLVLKSNQSNFSMWQNLIQCEDQLKNYEEARGHSEDAIEAFPSQTVFYYYKAHFAQLLKDYTTASATAKIGYEMGSDKTQLLIQLLSIMGDANNELKNFAASDEAFDKILELDPANLETLNNYSYYLSLRKEKLEKAEQMSKKTLDIDPKNASYLDTYGWILYQEKKFTEAKVYLEKALEQQPKNSVLNEHLGDVYFQLHQTESALVYWKIARDHGNTSQSLNQKINTGKLIE